jgi:hypothetical protein
MSRNGHEGANGSVESSREFYAAETDVALPSNFDLQFLSWIHDKGNGNGKGYWTYEGGADSEYGSLCKPKNMSCIHGWKVTATIKRVKKDAHPDDPGPTRTIVLFYSPNIWPIPSTFKLLSGSFSL